MSSEERDAREEFGALAGCFVEGSSEQRRRERRVKRRALAVSIVLQAAALAIVLLLPLFGKGDRIALAYAVPIPPYNPYAPQHLGPPRTPDHSRPNTCHFCVPPSIPHVIVTRDTTPPGVPSDPTSEIPGIPGAGNPSGIPIFDTRRGPTPPPPPPPPRIVRVTHLDPAMLTRRVEPVYPTIARQVRREGKVELHAIIGTDGTIQSLQVLSGDVIFVQSAIDAVTQWRYKPTYLNGQSVEVDTTITVIYTLAR
jgi:periplasmic protein TonB